MRRTDFLVGSAALAAATPLAARAASAGAGFDPRTPIPVVRARIGGRDVTFVIDTGYDLSTLAPHTADAIGLARTAVPNVTDYTRATLSGVALGGATLRDHGALVTDVSNWKDLAGFDVDGSLGYGAFSDRAITLDYVNRRLTFPGVLPDGETTAITWMKYHEHSPKLVTFEGLSIDGFPATTQFDTAMSKNVIVFTTKLPDLAVDSAPNAPPYTYEEAALRPGHVGSVRLGSTLLGANLVVYAAGADAHVPTTAIAAIAGDGLFAHRAVTLDYPGSRLIVS